MDALYISKGFTDFIKDKVGKNPKYKEQLDFLLRHERRHIAEKNVMKEIKTASLRWGARFTKKHVDQLITAGASVFCDCAIAAKIKELMTDAELRRLEQNSEESRMADAQDMVDQMEKEALSTAITKSMAVKSAESTTGGASSSEMGGSRSNGAELLPAGRDSSGSGA